MKKTSIKEAVIAVTYRCNSRCRMCNIWQIKEHSGELVAGDFSHLPLNLRDINITGGEPFLRGDLFEIIRVINKQCPKANIIISSNGFATELILSKMRQLLEIKPNIGVAISVDGIGEKHNKIRGIENGFEKVITTIKKLREIGVRNLKIGFTIGEYNPGELFGVYALAQELGTELSLTVVHSSENYFGKENTIKDKKEIVKALNWLIKKELSSWNPKNWARSYFAYGAREFVKTGERILPDYSGILSVFIDPQGVIYPCDVSNFKLGSLKNSGDIEKISIPQLSGCEKSWMVCTARQSIKKHFIRVIVWIILHKFLRKKI
ncbi:MAG: radical SAM protein [Candidatus Moranbacteria bacterium]|nr:radical SAM protein [Candidatus Moranbacteria bacterium]